MDLNALLKLLPPWYTQVLLPAFIGLCVIIGTIWKMREYFFKEPARSVSDALMAQLIKPKGEGDPTATPLWKQIELLGGRMNNAETHLYDLARDVGKVQVSQAELGRDAVALRSEVATIRTDTTEIKEILKSKTKGV